VIGAWIVTSGTHVGVAKHVGEAVRNYALAHGYKKPIIAIGIVPWGFISNREKLVNTDNQVCISVNQ